MPWIDTTVLMDFDNKGAGVEISIEPSVFVPFPRRKPVHYRLQVSSGIKD